MKSKREANTRSRLVLTLGFAVVLPALALIFVSFQHVKSIQRDKKVEALIHRDFLYLLANSAKKINGKAYELTDQAREAFPSEADSDDEKRRKLDAILAKNPWFAHVFMYDANKGVVVQQQRSVVDERELTNLHKMYGAWLGLEGHYLVDQLCKKPKPITWFSGESDRPEGTVYAATAIFAFPRLPKDRPILGGVSFDPKYLKQTFFPQMLDELTAQGFGGDAEQVEAQGFHKSTQQEERRLAMLVFPADTLRSEPDRPFAVSAGWNGGKPEVSQSLNDPFDGLAIGIKFQGT